MQEDEMLVAPPDVSSQENNSAARPTRGDTLSVSKRATDTTPPECDVCVICALNEEAEVFIREASRLCHVTFQRTFGSHTKREYRYATILNNEGEPVTIYVTWLPRYGPEEMALHFKPVLAELQPRFAAMTGICAADKDRVVLGDLIVAERAFLYDTGKIVSGKRGRKKQLYDTSTHQPHPDILQLVQMFDSWKPAVMQLRRPISKRQQRDWLLNTLLQAPTLSIDAIPQQELEQHAPDWKKIINELQSGRQPYVKDGALSGPARERLLSSPSGFPFKDPESPKRHIVSMASGSAVRSDNPFMEIQVPVRGAIAIDMEGATFYRTVAEFTGLHSLLVKGVCDYADSDKDDSYHDYASAISAIYVVSFIKDYVTTTLMTRPGHQLSISKSGQIDQQSMKNDQGSGRSKEMASSRSISADPHSTNSIKLDKAEREQLHKALLTAFPSRLDLKRMVDFGLDQNLDSIVSNSNLDHAVFELIKWAEAQGKVSELIRAAYQANSGNVQLQTFVSQRGFLGASDS
jgi:nucleoside phosphorylase